MSENQSDNIRREIGEEINGPARQYFENVITDKVIESIIELTAAVWTYRDRNIILEKVIEDLISDKEKISDLIESYKPTKEDNSIRAMERAELVSNVFRSFSRSTNLADKKEPKA